MGLTARPRRTAWAACLGFGASLVMAHLHLAGTVHGFCSDHGEPIHLPADARHDATPPPGTSVVGTHLHVAGGHGCPLLEFLVTPTTPTEGPVISLARPGRCSSWARGSSAAAAPISLLRQAPKHSPPPA